MSSAEEEALKKLGITLSPADAGEVTEEDLLKKLGIELPPPSFEAAFPTNMYDGLSLGEAMDRYKDIVYQKDENGEHTRELNPNIKLVGNSHRFVREDGSDSLIPEPETSLMGGAKMLFGVSPYDVTAKVGGLQILTKGVQESVSDLREADAAFLEKTGGADLLRSSPIGDQYPDDLVESAQEKAVNVDTGGTFFDALIADAGPAIIAGLPAGMGTVRALSVIPQTTSKVANVVLNTFKGITATLTGETAATLTTGTDEGTLVMGPNATFPAFPDLVDLGDEEADRVIEHRLNTLTEGMALGGLVLSAIATTKAATTTAAQFLLNGFVTAAKGPEKAVYMQLSLELANLPPDANEAMLAEARQRVAKIVEENKEVLVQSIRGMDENQQVTIDTVSALLKGTDNQADRSNALGVRAGAMNIPGSPVVDAVDAPIAAVQQDLKLQAQELGGDTAAQQTAKLQEGAELLTDTARGSVDELSGGLAQAQAKYDADYAKIMEGFDQDLEFTSMLDRLTAQYGTDLEGPATATRDRIKALLENAYVGQKTAKDSKYAAVSGGPIDAEAIIDQFEQINLGSITEAEYLLKSNRPVATLHKLVQPKMVADEAGEEGAMRRETPEEVIDRVQLFIDNDPKLNFGFFYKQIRQELGQLAGDLYTRGNGLAGSKVREFIKFIDNDMLDFVEQEGGDALAANAREAKRYFQEDYMFKSGGPGAPQSKLAEYADLYDSTLGRTNKQDLTATMTGGGFNRDAYDSSFEDLSTSWLEQGNRFDIAHLKKALSTLKGTDGGEIADYMVLKVLGRFALDARAGGIDGIDYGKLTSELGKYSSVLSANFPQKADLINGFLKRLETARGSQDELLKVLESTKASADKGIAQLQGSILTEFFDKSLTPQLKQIANSAEIFATSDPYKAFSGFFTGPETVSRMRQLLQAIEASPEANRPVIKDALKLAYNKFLDDKLIGRKLQTSGVTPMNVAPGERAADELTPLFQVGREIYGDEGEVLFSGLEASLGMARETEALKGASPIAGQSRTAFNQQARTNTNRMIAIFIGPLSRIGTRIRSILGGLIEKMNADERAMMIRQNILANPDEYLALASKYNKNPRDPLLEETLLYFLGSGLIKTDLEADAEGVPGIVEDARGEVSEAAEAINAVVQ
jgi:hypothetical protein